MATATKLLIPILLWGLYACGDDTSGDTSGTGGSAGSGAAGDTAGGGGSGGTGGTSGTAAPGGDGGTGDETGSGGEGGTSGGTGGTGGTDGSAGDENGSGAGGNTVMDSAKTATVLDQEGKICPMSGGSPLDGELMLVIDGEQVGPLLVFGLGLAATTTTISACFHDPDNPRVAGLPNLTLELVHFQPARGTEDPLGERVVGSDFNVQVVIAQDGDKTYQSVSGTATVTALDHEARKYAGTADVIAEETGGSDPIEISVSWDVFLQM